MTETALPPAARTRLETLDVLRGLALLGILAVNAPFFAMPWPWTVQLELHPPATPWDAAAWWAVSVFFEGKFISLFSMLFGISLFLVGRERSDRDAGARLRRRLGWLLVFGLIHGAAIWYGDILLTYAVSGFLVMFARSWSAPTLLTVGASVLALMAVLTVAGTLLGEMFPMPPEAEAGQTDFFLRAIAQALSADGGYRGGFADSLAANARDWSFYLAVAALPGLLFVAPLMLVGLGLFKAGVFTGEARPGVYRGLLAVGAGYLLLLGVLTALAVQADYRGLARSLADGLNSFLAPLASLAYLSLIVPAVARGGLRWLVRLLAPVGRMAFSNYLTQSLIMTALFYGGRGPGLFADVERAAQLAIVAAVWVVQIVWSRWWLDRFAYGPFEWAWRSLTEGRAVPFRHAVAPPAT